MITMQRSTSPTPIVPKCSHLDRITVDELSSRFEAVKANVVCNECHTKQHDLLVCLDCMHIGCGREQQRHAIEHHVASESASKPHELVAHLFKPFIWCYGCDREVAIWDNTSLEHDSETAAKLREALETFHGADEPVTAPTPQPRSASHDAPRARRAVVGLENLGNTCYINAALQALLVAQPFVGYFKDATPFVNLARSRHLSVAMAYFVNQVFAEPSHHFVPTAIVREIKLLNPSFRGFSQQDAHELLRFVLDTIHEELKRPLPISTSPPQFVDSDSESDTETNSDSENSETPKISRSSSPRISRSSSPIGTSSASHLSSSLSGLTHPRPSSALAGFNSFSAAAPLHHGDSPDPPPGDLTLKSCSIVSDTFGGTLVSKVFCDGCHKISTTSEPFFDLSLPIDRSRTLPNTKKPRSASPGLSDDEAAIFTAPSTESISLPDASPGKKSRGWKGLANYFTQVFTLSSEKDAMSLKDCLNSFFAPEMLSGSEQYFCEHCKKRTDSAKRYFLKSLPEMLCVQLKRFRQDGASQHKVTTPVKFPLRGLDMGPYSLGDAGAHTKYDLTAVVCHRGSMASGHYTSFAFDNVAEKWHEMDDGRVRACSSGHVENAEAYILFYKRRSPRRLRTLRELTHEDIRTWAQGDHDEDERASQTVPVSKRWYNLFIHSLDPGPLTPDDFVCPHGTGMARPPAAPPASAPGGATPQPPALPSPSDLCISVPRGVYKQLLDRFDGEWPPDDLQPQCAQCFDEELSLNKRREHEAEQISLLDRQSILPGQFWYLMSSTWLKQWNEFRAGTGPLPGAIGNHVLLDADGVTPRSGLRPFDHYRGVNRAVWEFLVHAYGGGPAVVRDRIDIYAEARVDSNPSPFEVLPPPRSPSPTTQAQEMRAGAAEGEAGGVTTRPRATNKSATETTPLRGAGTMATPMPVEDGLPEIVVSSTSSNVNLKAPTALKIRDVRGTAMIEAMEQASEEKKGEEKKVKKAGKKIKSENEGTTDADTDGEDMSLSKETSPAIKNVQVVETDDPDVHRMTL